jgi:3-oxoacyl-[acyl-carrier-protein] synthase III
MARRSVLIGTGSALPENRVTNHELAKTVDTSHEWIVERTGIESRYYAAPHETTSTLAIQAGKRAMEAANVEQVDLIILATTTPDQVFPASATLIQHALGQNGCIAFDVAAVCTGFLYALSVADAMIRAGNANTALVIGAETLSRILDWKERSTCVLFGDGAGAVVLQGQESERGIIATKLHADGKYNDMLKTSGGVSTTQTIGTIQMKGNEVFRHAVTNLASVLDEVMEMSDWQAQDIDWVVPHQANKRILDATAKKLNLPESKMVITVNEHANTSAASVPLALDTAVRDGRIKQGDKIILEAMGGGFTWGGATLIV